METNTTTTPAVAVIGCGYWGKNLIRNFAELDALVAVCDGEADVAGQYAQQHGVRAGSLEDILAEESIDAVVIATPAETHARLVEQALNAGKHVFVEKPIALEVEDAIRVRDLAARAGRVLMVGHLLQYHPVFLKLKELVADGTLGRLRHIYSHRLNFGKVRREENILWSFAPHDISMILSLVGEEPESIAAMGSFYLHSKIADVTTTHLVFPGGVNAHVFVSWLHPYKEQKLVIVGDESMAVFDDTRPWEEKLQLYPHRIEWKNGLPVPNKADAKAVAIESAEPLREEAGHFLDCIRGNALCRTDGDEAIRVLKVLQASELAISGNRVVRMNELNSAPAALREYFVHSSAFIDDGCEIGKGTKVWHFSHVLSGSRIGENCVLGQNVMVGPDVTIGNNCKVQNNVSLYKGITLEEGVFCGPSCVFTNVNTPRAEIERKDEFLPTVVRRGVTIGANATIVCGTELGEYSFIAAAAVVIKDVPPFALMTGVPAKQIGWVGHAGEKLDENLVCPRTGRQYRLNADQQLEEIMDN
ncbi:MAG: Gfo/Idh/MocA family oxidoreductase [Gammaproteobacteria bacterium]